VLLAFRPMDSVRCTADHGCLDFLYQRFSSDIVTKPVNSETHKQNGCHVPTMVLSEALGLSLFRVIREGLGSSKRLCVRGTQRLTSQCRLALEPECLSDRLTTAREIPGGEADSRDTQAVCSFRCWASNETPFFQTINVIAAILRASVSRAISGRIPLATRAA
jgi:hypothetical protein